MLGLRRWLGPKKAYMRIQRLVLTMVHLPQYATYSAVLF